MTEAPTIILVTPQMGENIGATARVMKNFGLTRLRLVAPRDGWPNPKAEAMASGAVDVIQQAEVYATLAEAYHDIQYLYGFCPRHREMHKPHLNVEQGIAETLKKPNVALAFGSERVGLTNQEISLCDAIVTIPVSPEYPSMNLAQAVGVACYEYARQAENGALRPYARPHEDFTPPTKATTQDMAHLFTALETALQQTGFLNKPEMRDKMVLNLRATLLRAGLSAAEVRSLQGVLKALVKLG